MSKPTLVQTLLKQPSQRYINAPDAGNGQPNGTANGVGNGTGQTAKKEYHSTRQEMARIAASQTQSASTPNPNGGGTASSASGGARRHQEDTRNGAKHVYDSNSHSSRAKGAPSPSTSTQRPPPAPALRNPIAASYSFNYSDLSNDSDSESLDVFFTPNSSPRTSMVSSVGTITFPSARRPSRRSLTNLKPPDAAATSASPHQTAKQISPEPTSTPRSKPASASLSPSTPTPTPKQTTTHVLPPPPTTKPPLPTSAPPSAAVPSTRTPTATARNALSTASSISSTSLEAHSVFSSTPSINGDAAAAEQGAVGIGRSAPVRSTSTSRRTATRSGTASGTGTGTEGSKWRSQQHSDEEWAKDVRWLVPPTGGAAAGSGKSSERAAGKKAESGAAVTSASATKTPDRVLPTANGGAGAYHGNGKGKERERDAGDEEAKEKSDKGKGKERDIDKGKGREIDKERENGRAGGGEGVATRTTMQTSTPPPGRTKYVPPRQHTFSAFASVSASSTPVPITSAANGVDAAAGQAKGPSEALWLAGVAVPASGSVGSSSTRYSNTPASDVTASTTPKVRPLPTPKSGSPSPQPSSTTNYHHQRNGSSSSNSAAPKLTPRALPTIPQPPSTPPPTIPPMPIITPLMRGMDAVLEEDEDGALTPKMEALVLMAQHEDDDARGWDWTSGSRSSGTAPTTNTSTSAGAARLRHTTAPTMTRRRRSRSLDGSSSSSSSSSTSPAHTHPSSGPGSQTRRMLPHTPAPKTLAAEVHALVAGFAPAGALPSTGTPGYTGLVLPRAPPSLAGTTAGRPRAKERTGSVDLTRTGAAQTTMATVEVVRGLGAAAGGGGVLGFLGLGRRRSLSASGRGRGPAPVPVPGRASVDGVAGRGAEPVQTTPLGFTAYRAPPGYVPSTSVLVQVWAVGLDGLDGRLVGVRFGSGSAGIGAGPAREAEAEAVGYDANDELDAEADERTADVHGGGGGGAVDPDTDTDTPALFQSQSSAAHAHSSPPPTTTPTKKGPLAALGRSLSLRLSRKSKNRDLQHAAAAVHASPPPTTQSTPPRIGNPHPAPAPQPQPSPPRRGSTTNANTAASNGTPAVQPPSDPRPRQISLPKRTPSWSLKRSSDTAAGSPSGSPAKGASPGAKRVALRQQEREREEAKRKEEEARRKEKERERERERERDKVQTAEVGYIPGRSFVGRVLECGWEVREEAVRKGEWVVGLLDVRKAGALSEFIVVDRHRVRRVPHPRKADGSPDDSTNPTPVWVASPNSPSGAGTLSLEELALLPLSGLPAYRAVRTFVFAFSSTRDGHSSPGSGRAPYDLGAGSLYSHGSSSDHEAGHRRRALVLRGHAGAGAMAVQLLARRGWRVSVHVPFSCIPTNAPQPAIDACMHAVEERARAWGADEVIFDDGDGAADDGRGAAVRVLDSLREDGDVFDAVLDTVGGRDVWAAGERLLRSPGTGAAPRRRGVGQFTTLVGDWPERAVPTAKDNLRSGFRAMRMGSTDSAPGIGGANGSEESHGKVGYAWVSVAQDVDWEGDGVAETLGTVVRLAMEDGVLPPVGSVDSAVPGVRPRVVPFEKAPQVFVDNGPLGDGGTVVVKIAG